MPIRRPLAAAILLVTLAAGLLATSTAPSQAASPTTTPSGPSAEEVRRAAERYRDVQVIRADS